MTRDQMINHLILTGWKVSKWQPQYYPNGVWQICNPGLGCGCDSGGRYIPQRHEEQSQGLWTWDDISDNQTLDDLYAWALDNDNREYA